jgi:hypothetical protein
MTNLISLLLLLCVGFLLLAATDLVMLHHSEDEPSQDHSNRLDKLLVLICTSGCCIAIYGGESESTRFISQLSVKLRNISSYTVGFVYS